MIIFWQRQDLVRQPEDKMKKKNIFIIITGLLIGLILLKIFFIKPVSRPQFLSEKAKDMVVVRVMKTEKKDLQFVLFYVGSLKAKDEINVFSKVSGKLWQYTAKEGDSVEKDQAVALIDRDETGLKYELAKVESPISGIVAKTLLDKGANVLPATGAASATPLAIVVNMDEMAVKVNAPEPDIPYLKTGLKAKIKVDAYPEDEFIGEISKVSEIVDTQTRTLPIEITIPNQDHRLKSGMFCRIRIFAGEHKDVLVVLQDALIQELGTQYVFVAEEHIAKKKKVTTGIREDSWIEILEGLKPDDRVIVFGHQGLKDGSAVEISQE